MFRESNIQNIRLNHGNKSGKVSTPFFFILNNIGAYGKNSVHVKTTNETAKNVALRYLTCSRYTDTGTDSFDATIELKPMQIAPNYIADELN